MEERKRHTRDRECGRREPLREWKLLAHVSEMAVRHVRLAREAAHCWP